MAVRRPIHGDRRKMQKCRSELGRKIAVDFEADADLNEGRSCPGHGRFLLFMREVLTG